MPPLTRPQAQVFGPRELSGTPPAPPPPHFLRKEEAALGHSQQTASRLGSFSTPPAVLSLADVGHRGSPVPRSGVT